MLYVYVPHPLSTKSFHGASAGNPYACSLKSSIGKASRFLYLSPAVCGVRGKVWGGRDVRFTPRHLCRVRHYPRPSPPSPAIPAAGMRPGDDMEPLALCGRAVAEAMDQIEGIEERGRDGHGAIEARATFLPTLKREDGRLDIDPIGRQGQGLRGTTARIQQRPAIGADLTGSGFGGGAERGPLGAGEIQAVALRVIDLHASGGGHGVPFARRKTRIRKISIYSVKRAKKIKPKICTGQRIEAHVGMDPSRRFPCCLAPARAFFVRFVAPRAGAVVSAPKGVHFTENAS